MDLELNRERQDLGCQVVVVIERAKVEPSQQRLDPTAAQ
jgi:hypothetical protein